MAMVIFEPCTTCSGEGSYDDQPPPRDTRRVRCEECGGGAVYACCPECQDHITGSGTVIAGDLARVQAQIAEWPGDLDAQAWLRAYECVKEHGYCPGCVAQREEEETQARMAAAISASVRIVEAEYRQHCLACERTIQPRAKMLSWPALPKLAFCDECRQNIARAVAS